MEDATTAVLNPAGDAGPALAPSGALARIRRAVIEPSVRKGALSLFDQAIVSGTNFATSVVIGRLCSKEDMGVYYLALSIVYFARGIQEQIVSAPYQIYCSRRDGETAASYAGSAFVHQALFSLAAVVCMLGFSQALAFGLGPAAMSSTVWVMLGVMPLMLLREYIRHFSFAHFRMRTAVILDATVAAVQIAALVVLGSMGLLTIPVVYAVIGGACLVASFAWVFLKRQKLEFSARGVWSDWVHNWKFSKWALASQLVGASSPYILPWFVAAAQGEAATGVYAVSTTLVGLANMFVMGLSNFLTPKAANAYANEGVSGLKRVLYATSAIFIVVLGGFALTTVVAGDWIAAITYGAKYIGAGPVIAVFAFSMLANSLCVTAGNGLWAMERPSANFRADLTALIAIVGCSIWLVPVYGPLGAAYAALIGNVVDAVVRWVILKKLMASTEALAHSAQGGDGA